MRRVIAGVAAGVLLGALVAAGGAYALWGRTVTLDEGIVTTGDFAVEAEWEGGTPPTWAALFPGQTRTGKITVTGSGAGTTLRWRLFVSGSAPALAPHVTFEARECVSNQVIGAGGYPAPPAAPLVAGETVCVRLSVTLLSTAPGSLQGVSTQPVITVTGNQVSE